MTVIGRNIHQKGGFKAFIPESFPPKNLNIESRRLMKLGADASLLSGKLDGICKLLPDIDFFIFMYIKKESAYSSQIEGTKANLTHALQAEVERTPDLPNDVDDILHYIKAMNLGLKRLNELPFSLRLIKEVHSTLLKGARTDSYAYPGEFRKTQNWIMGTKPSDARFVPPPPEYVVQAMSELEKFVHTTDDIPQLIKAGLLHAQFETIHPFIDGNGRTGRLLITFYLCEQNVLSRPILYLSTYFKKHRELYFDLLDKYRKGEVEKWLEFFLRGVCEVAQEAIDTSKRIIDLRERDLNTMSLLGNASKNATMFLKNLYKLPIVNLRKAQEITGISREGANKLISRFVKLGILKPKDKKTTYGRLFIYKDYLDLF
ncbi:MAG: Fic family protein [Planctomycetes bacterium]|nr:Fic family protein [Planctomycetota bacterium]